MNFTLDTMQELISKRSRFSYPLHTINVNEFTKLDDGEKKNQIKLKLEALEKAKIDGLAKVKTEDTSENNLRALNRIIRKIRSGDTETSIVVELYETIVELRGNTKKIHWEIHEALEGQVKISSIRRILSELRNDKLR